MERGSLDNPKASFGLAKVDWGGGGVEMRGELFNAHVFVYLSGPSTNQG